MEYHVRKANILDALTISKHNIAAAWDSEQWIIDPIIALKGVESILTDPNKGFYLVAETAGVIIGQLMITFEWSDWRNQPVWWIQSVFVQSDWRQKGVFRVLYEYVIQYARENGVASVKLYADKRNHQAKAVYRAVGMSDEHYDLFEINL